MVFLATLMIPFEVTIFTNLQTVVTTSAGYNTYQGLAVPFLATGFGAFLLRQAFLQVPRDLQDAAALDGYGHLRFMVRVAVPLARPDDRGARGVLVPRGVEPVPLAAARHRGRRAPHGAGRPQAAPRTSSSTRSTSRSPGASSRRPAVILLIVFQKQLVRGLTAGAVKG